MSILDRLRPDTAAATSAVRSATPWSGPDDGPVGPVMALLTGVWTAALSWLVIALPALLAWATSAQATAAWGEAVRVSTDVWLLLHHVGLTVPAGSVSIAPLAATAVPVLLCWLAGRRIGAALDRRDLEAAASPARALAPAIAGLAAGYTAVLVVAALLARAPGYQPVVWQALVAGLLLPTVAAGAAGLRACGVPVLGTLAGLLHVPHRIRRTARAAGLGAASLVGAGALLLAGTLVWHADRVLALHRALDAGVVGGAVLVLAQVALLPNLALWAVGFVAGPGFAVGTGTLVTPGGSDLGLLPLVPVLGAVPPPGALPSALAAVVLVPVLVGAVVGWQVVARAAVVPARWLDAVTDALTAVVSTTVLVTVLVALSGGAAGPGALSAVGPSPWRVALVLAAELGAGAAVAAWLTHRRRAA